MSELTIEELAAACEETARRIDTLGRVDEEDLGCRIQGVLENAEEHLREAAARLGEQALVIAALRDEMQEQEDRAEQAEAAMRRKL
jgi:hypothetical protein